MARHTLDRGHNMDRRTTLARFLKLERRASANDQIAVARMRNNPERVKPSLATFAAIIRGRRTGF